MGCGAQEIGRCPTKSAGARRRMRGEGAEDSVLKRRTAGRKEAGAKKAGPRHRAAPTMSWRNILKIAARKKRFRPSPIKHFYMLIYLLYFRYKVELGITMMTYTEATVTNTIIGFLVFSVVNLGSRFVFSSLVRLWQLFRCVVWAYNHMGQLDIKDKMV